jgi:hypothetical protein
MTKRGQRLLHAAVAVVLATAASSCLLLNWRYEVAGSGGAGTAESSSEATTSTGGTMGCVGVSFAADPPCTACVATFCCPELAACRPGTPCGALFACVENCLGDTTCLTGCVTAVAGAKSAAEALATCYQEHCGGDVSCGDVCDLGVRVSDGDGGDDLLCGDCFGANCCAEFGACRTDTTCWGCATGDTSPCTAADAGNAHYKNVQSCIAKCNGTCSICTTSYGTGDAVCDLCLTTSCCDEWTTCEGDFFCPACLEAPTFFGCDSDPLYLATTACRSAHCAVECAGH